MLGKTHSGDMITFFLCIVNVNGREDPSIVRDEKVTK